MKNDISLDTINMPIHSNVSSRPGTKQDFRTKNNKSLKELMQDKSLMNYEKLDNIKLDDYGNNKKISYGDLGVYNKDSLSALQNDRSSVQGYSDSLQRPNTFNNAQR